jgi:hypothetical protein
MSESDDLITILELPFETRQVICRHVGDVLNDFASNIRDGIKSYKEKAWDERNNKVETARLEGMIYKLYYCIDQFEAADVRIVSNIIPK